MANTRNAASLILSVGALTLSIVAFGIAHNQAELQKASARAATGAVIAAQQEKKGRCNGQFRRSGICKFTGKSHKNRTDGRYTQHGGTAQRN